MVIKTDTIYLLSLYITLLSAYPIFESRVPESSVQNSPRDFGYWVRPDPEPLYGYPDYGDYAEPRPVYSELDIVRQQLARPQQFPLPYIKRFPPAPPPPVPVYETAWDEDSSNYNNGMDNELPLYNSFPQAPLLQNPGLEALTEALRDALIQQGQIQDAFVLPESTETDNEDDADILEDEMVRELKETAVKKSGPMERVVTRPQTSTTASVVTITSVPALVSDEGDEAKNDGSGQKEIPLLRPPKRPVTGKETDDKRTESKIDQQNNFSRYKNHNKQRVHLVSSDDELMQELNGLKKRHQ